MGSPEVKLKLKSHLAKIVDVATDLNEVSLYWQKFWTLPTSVDDIVAVFLPCDIRYIRDNHRSAFTKLIHSITNRLIYLTKLKKFPSANFPYIELLNCIRLLTVILPFLYEKPSLLFIENDVFWNRIYRTPFYSSHRAFHENISSDTAYSDVSGLDGSVHPRPDSGVALDNTVGITHQDTERHEKPVGSELIDSCLDLLFTSEFTVENTRERNQNSNFANFNQLTVWEPGYEAKGLYQDPKLKYDSNRLEIVRFLLVLFSRNMYCLPSSVVKVGSRFLTYFVSATNGRKYYILCLSLLNTLLRSLQSNGDKARVNEFSDPEHKNNNGLEVPDENHKKIRILMVTNAIQLFTLMIAYSLPKNDIDFLFGSGILSRDETARNRTRMFLNKVNTSKDMNFIIRSLTGSLLGPVLDDENNTFTSLMKTSKLLGSGEVHLFSKEIMIVILEFYQCNSKFRVYFAEIAGAQYFIALMYYITKFKDDGKYKRYLKLCVYNLLYLSSEFRMANKLLIAFDPDIYESLPNISRTPTFPTSYRDYLILQICNLLISKQDFEYSLQLCQVLYNLICIHVLVLEHSRKGDLEITQNRRFSVKDLSKCPPTQVSYAASALVMQLIAKMSSFDNLAKEYENQSENLSLLLRACCHAISRDPTESVILLYTFSKNANLLNRLSNNLTRLSEDRFRQILIDEKKEFDMAIQNRQMQFRKLLYQQVHDDEDNEDYIDYTTELEKYDALKSKDSLDFPPISRQNTQTTLDSIPSVRSMPALTRQTSQISISNASPKIGNGAFENSIDPLCKSNGSLPLQKSADDNNDHNRKQSDSLIIDLDREGFSAGFPIGMTSISKGKRRYYAKYSQKWPGKEALSMLRESAKMVNSLVVVETSNLSGNQLGNASYVIQKLMRLDLEGLMNNIPKSKIYDSSKMSYSPLKLKWNHHILGWYLSVIWGDIFANYNCYEEKGLLAEISSGLSVIKRASSSWGFGSWKFGNKNSLPKSSPLSLESNSDDKNLEQHNSTSYGDNILENPVWIGTHIQLFKVNPELLRDHYTMLNNKSEIFYSTGLGAIFSPVLGDSSWKRNSTTTSHLNQRNGSSVFTEEFWKRQGGRGLVDRRGSDHSLKSHFNRESLSGRPSIS